MTFFPENPKRDQNLKFTHLSETTSISAPFIWESPHVFLNMAIHKFITSQTTAWWLTEMEPLKAWIVSLPEKKSRALSVDWPSQIARKSLLCRSSHEVLTKIAAWLLEVRSRISVAFFFLFTWNEWFLQTFVFKFVCHKLTSIFGPNFSC